MSVACAYRRVALQTIRKHKPQGQRIETATAFFLRYYRTTEGQRKKVMVKLADKNREYRCWDDVEPLIARLLETSEQSCAATAQLTIAAFVHDHYLPWVKANKAAVTYQGYLDVVAHQRRCRQQ